MRFLLFITGLITFQIQAQQVSGVVVNAEQEPIPYVNIWNMDSSAGATTDDNGCFSIPFAEEGEEISLWASGYERQFKEITASDTIVLQKIQKEVNPDELIVYPEKTLHHTIGEAHFENFYFNPGNLQWTFAHEYTRDEEMRPIQDSDKDMAYRQRTVSEGHLQRR